MSTDIKRILWLFVCVAVGLTLALGVNMPPLGDRMEEARAAFEPAQQEWEQIYREAAELDELYGAMRAASDALADNLDSTQGILSELIAQAELDKQAAEQSRQSVDQMLAVSSSHREQAKDALDLVLSKILGDPVGQTFGKRATIKVYSLKEAGYRGYMAKVKLHDPSAIRLVLAQDKVGSKGETTSQAAKRTGAKLAINAGGFARQDGLLYPIGITVVDGEIKTFSRTDMSFIGFDKNGKLVGGELKTREEIEALNVVHGASFVPTLLENGKKLKIPAKWANKKEPRTLIGNFANGDLLLIVIDGRQKGYSNGVTLEEAQDKLLEFNVRDAYNLDGGGSSTFYYNGKVLNSPSDGRERPVASNFVVLP